MPDMRPYGDNAPPTLSLTMVWRCPVHPDSQEVWLRRFERSAPTCREILPPPSRRCGKTMERVDPDDIGDTL